jgi:carboxymethylenebutenolidase
MGGPMTMQAAACLPGRIGAGASFYFGIAANDDEKQPHAKGKLDESFRAAKGSAKIEVYPGTLHGWCVQDMPVREGKPIYNEPQAERAWNELVTLYKRALV